LVLSNARAKGTSRVISFSEEMAGFVEGLASQAAVAMVNQQLVDSQQRLLDSLIKLISGAIDANPPIPETIAAASPWWVNCWPPRPANPKTALWPSST
jgi:hypothetical protein